MKANIEITNLSEVTQSLSILVNRLVSGLIIVGMLVGSALATVASDPVWKIIPFIGVIGFLTAMVLGIMLLVNVWGDIGKIRRIKTKEEKRLKDL